MFFDLCTTTILLVEQNANLVLKVAYGWYAKETDLVAFSDTDDNLLAHDEA